MIAEYEVTYASGRVEKLRVTSPKKVKEYDRDLVAAKNLGAVLSYSKIEFKNAADRKEYYRKLNLKKVGQGYG